MTSHRSNKLVKMDSFIMDGVVMPDARFKVAWDLFVALKENQENVLLSPSAVTALLFPWLKVTRGLTAKELVRSLRLTSLDEEMAAKVARLLSSSSDMNCGEVKNVKEKEKEKGNSQNGSATAGNVESKKTSTKTKQDENESSFEVRANHPDLERLLDRARDLLQLSKTHFDVLSSEENFAYFCTARVFVREETLVTPTFAALMLDVYGNDVGQLDVRWSKECNKTINTWVDKATGGLMKEVMAPSHCHDTTQVILVNTFCIKVNWMDRLQTNGTRKSQFYTTNKQSEDVHMLSATAMFAYTHHEDLQCGLLSVPLRGHGERFSLLILLPDEVGGLNKLEVRMKVHDLMRMKRNMQMHLVQLRVPPLKLEATHSLTQPLRQLGVIHAFDPHSRDFTGVSSNPLEQLSLTHAIHKVLLVMNEPESVQQTAAPPAKGDIPSSISVPSFSSNTRFHSPSTVELETIFQDDSVSMKAAPFRVNHPFMLFVWDEVEDSILFMARVRRLQQPDIVTAAPAPSGQKRQSIGASFKRGFMRRHRTISA